MKLCGLAFVVAAMMASMAIPAEAATVYRILKKSNRAVFKLNDSELLKVNEGDLISMSGPSGKKVSGKVVKLMESRALVKVSSGFSAISKNANFTLLAQNEVEDDYESSSSSMSTGADMEMGDSSPSPFANEFQPGSGGDALGGNHRGFDSYGKEEAAHIARVPRWQAGLWYDHFVSLDVKLKNDDADEEDKIKSKGISSINIYGIGHIVPKFWIGGLITLDDAKYDLESETAAGEETYKLTNEVQTITLMGAFQLNNQWVLGVALDSVSDKLEIDGDASGDETISYTRVRPSVAYYSDKYELVVSHRARYSISEDGNSVMEPAQLKAEGEMYMSDATSLRSTLAYVWYNRANQNDKNLIVPSFGLVQRMGKHRFEGELFLRDNHFREDDSENVTNVRWIGLTLGYFHQFAPNMEGHGGLEYANINGGDDVKVTGSELVAILGFNYKG